MWVPVPTMASRPAAVVRWRMASATSCRTTSTPIPGTQLLAINGTITLPTSSGAAQTVNLYGQARGKAGLPAGVYTDTVSVELSF